MVVLLHLLLLRTSLQTKPVTARPEAKVCHITLSRVKVRKPPPPVIPPAPEIIPIEKPHPKPVIKPKTQKKRVHKKKRHRRKKVKHKTEPKPVPKPDPVHPPVPARAEPPAQQAPRAAVATATLKARYIALIRRKIRQNLYYPKIARRMRKEGTVKVAFRVMKDGSVEGVQVLSSPGSMLANGALRTIRSLKLPPIPPALGMSQLKLFIPIEFKLTKGDS